jgi:hypothetical protein
MLDYNKCHPEKCDKGICLAGLACPYKILKQEVPYEMPDPNPNTFQISVEAASLVYFRGNQLERSQGATSWDI